MSVIWCPSGNELRRIYLLDPEGFASGPLELPIPDELKAAVDEAMEDF